MNDQPSSNNPTPDAPPERGGASFASAKQTVENVFWVIGIGSALNGFVKSSGGLVEFLMGVGNFGFACYVAAFAAIPIMMGWAKFLDCRRRDMSDSAFFAMMAAMILIIGWLINRALFGPGANDDLDTFGRTFTALIGVLVLILPIGMLVYVKHTTPRPRP